MIICPRLFQIWRSIGNRTDENRVKGKFTQDLASGTQKNLSEFVCQLLQLLDFCVVV